MNRSTLYYCVLGMIINYKWNMNNIFVLSVFRIHSFVFIFAKQKQWKYNTIHEEQELCQWMFIRRECLCIDWKHESYNLIIKKCCLCIVLAALRYLLHIDIDKVIDFLSGSLDTDTIFSWWVFVFSIFQSNQHKWKCFYNNVIMVCLNWYN